MATGLIDIMKRASMNAMDDNQMCDLRFGTIVSISPLKVQVTNQFTIPESILIVPQHLTNYDVTINMSGWTTDNKSGGSGDSSFSSHAHAINQTNKITINNALKIGDKVALIRKTGGQSYYILDRI